MPVSLFTNEADEIKVSLAVAEVDQKTVCDPKKEELLKAHKSLKDEDVVDVTMSFRIPTYGDQNRIFDACVKVSDESVNISPAMTRFERLCVLAKSWSIKGPKGEETKPTRESIRKLNAVIATYVGLELEAQLRKRGLL